MNMPIKMDDRTANFFRLHSDATFLCHEIRISVTKAMEQRPATTIGTTRMGSLKWLPSSVIKPMVALSAFDLALQFMMRIVDLNR